MANYGFHGFHFPRSGLILAFFFQPPLDERGSFFLSSTTRIRMFTPRQLPLLGHYFWIQARIMNELSSFFYPDLIFAA
jgi:hypothetical protein